MPIYKVDRQGRDPRVVEAPNPAAARRHVANDEFTVSILSAKDAFALSNKGAKLETAGEEPEPEKQPHGHGGMAGADAD